MTKTTKLRLADKLQLPLEAATETLAVLGRRGSGKTHTASVFVEELLSAGIHTVVLDPLDVWAGLRSSADGKSEGFPVVVFGGAHGDLPLEGASGRVLADAVVDHQLSAVLSLRHLSKTEQRRFVGEFCERLYERKGVEEHRAPLHVVIDEADAFVAQRMPPGGERAYGAIDTLVRRGRSSGFGTTLISQRAAVIAKDVLTQTEVLVCHQTTGPQDRKALEAWIEQNDSEGHRAEFLRSLASLRTGEAWFWSPAWLRIFQRVQVRKRKTFDSSSTPKVGQARVAPKKLAPVDIDALRAQLAAVVEKAAGDDPKALRKRIVELERELTKARAGTADSTELARLRAEVASWQGAATLAQGVMADAGRAIERACDALEKVGAPRRAPQHVPAQNIRRNISSPKPAAVASPKPKIAARAPSESRNISLGKGETATLTVLLQHPNGCTREQLTIITGYKRSTRDAYVQRLRAAGLVEVAGAVVRAVPGAEAAVPDFEPLPTGAALLTHWLERLPQGEAEVLRVANSAYPESVTRDEVSDATGYKRSTRDAYIQRLKARALVQVTGGGIRMSEVLA
jgi:hypothetical protein